MEVIASFDLVIHFAKDFTDFVLDGLGVVGTLTKACERGEKLPVYKAHRSEPVIALLWSTLPSVPLGMALVLQP